jgi:hypothetical protein
MAAAAAWLLREHNTSCPLPKVLEFVCMHIAALAAAYCFDTVLTDASEQLAVWIFWPEAMA